MCLVPELALYDLGYTSDDMRERRKIVELWQRGDAAVLVTLVRVEGSSYRQVGARVLIAANGDSAGTISGGCLEAEVVRKAQWMVRGGAVVERYSTLFDDTAELPYGLGCGGIVDLLLEPAGTAEFDAVMQAMRDSLTGKRLEIVTRLPEQGATLAREVRDESGAVLFASLKAATEMCAPSEGRGFSHAANTLQKNWSFSPGGITGADVFAEWLEPPQRLIVLGAGDDAQPMVQMAALLGWSVIVADGRAQMARAERFPEAELVVCADSAAEFAIGARDAVVIMSHSYEQDRAWLTEVLPARPRYLGLLGARHRSALLVSETALRLGWSVERVCEGLFAPVGMDLGGDGAEAIALATIAEIQACCEGKLGASRRMTARMVAEMVEAGGPERYLQTPCAL
jgi:xanthine/CO dehydrogenase XdhC/CoxF family maturation factor